MIIMLTNSVGEGTLSKTDIKNLKAMGLVERGDKQLSKISELSREQFDAIVQKKLPHTSLTRKQRGESQDAATNLNSQKLDLFYKVFENTHKRVLVNNMSEQIDSHLKRQAEDLKLTSRMPTA